MLVDIYIFTTRIKKEENMEKKIEIRKAPDTGKYGVVSLQGEGEEAILDFVYDEIFHMGKYLMCSCGGAYWAKFSLDGKRIF